MQCRVNLIKRHQSSEDDLTDPDITDPEITPMKKYIYIYLYIYIYMEEKKEENI